MRSETWDGATVDEVTRLVAPTWPVGTGHRIRPRLLAGGALDAVTEVVKADDGRPIAVMHVSDDPTFRGNVGAVLAVAPSHRGRGIGRMLSERVMPILESRARTRKPLVTLREELASGRRLAEGLGFRVVSRSVGWEAPLSSGAAASHRQALRDLEALRGIRVDAVAIETHRASFDDVARRATAGLPRVSGEDDEIDASAAWTYFFSPDGTILIATMDGDPVGASIVGPVPGRGDWYVEFTGVDPAARGRGVARALKHAQFMIAAENGGTRVITYNDERNTPILALNASFGMTRRPGYVGMTI